MAGKVRGNRGPAGSGKSTYCNGMQQYLTLTGRKVAVINLDPANDSLPYECAVDVMELVSLEKVQQELGLGPNGGLMYCAEYLEQNLDWLEERLAPLIQEERYLLFDCPGQVELFTLHGALKHVVDWLTTQLAIRLVAVHLVDAHLCSDASKYMSALLVSLGAMLHLGLPHLNLLAKVDQVHLYGRLPLSLDFFTEARSLGRLWDSLESDPFSRRYRKLSLGLCEVVEDFGLLSFVPLAIEDKECVARVVALADKCNGYAFAGLQGRSPYPPEFLYGADAASDGPTAYEEKYMSEAEGLPAIEERTVYEEVLP